MTTLTILPSIPPLALIVFTAKSIPFLPNSPQGAALPESDKTTPIFISDFGAGFLSPTSKTTMTTAIMTMTNQVIFLSIIILNNCNSVIFNDSVTITCVIPAKAGIQNRVQQSWIPTFVGMTQPIGITRFAGITHLGV